MDNKTLTTWERIKDSDIYFSFIKSPTAIISSLILFIIFFCSFFVEFITPYNPFDPSSLSLMEAFTPPSWTEDGLSKFILGTDGQGRDMSLPCPSVPSINFDKPSSVQDGGVNASIKDKDDGSNGLYGVINSTKNEQKKIINKIKDEIIAVGDLIKLK